MSLRHGRNRFLAPGVVSSSVAMDILSEIYLTRPETEEISLQHAHLTSLDVELPLLKQFRELRHLDVSHNELTSLPMELVDLTRLVALDVSANPIASVRDVLPVLQLLPSLKSLSLTLTDAADEQLLLAALPKLRILNATPLHFPTTTTSGHESRRPSEANEGHSSATSSIQWHDPALPTNHVQNVASILNVLKGIGVVVPPGSEEDHRVSRMFEQQVELIGMSLKTALQEHPAQPENQAAEILLAKFKITAACASYATQKAGECAPELGLAWQTLSLLHQDIASAFYALTQQLVLQQPPPGPPPPLMDPTQLKQLLEVAEVLESDVQRGAKALMAEQAKVSRLEDEMRRLKSELAIARQQASASPPHTESNRSPRLSTHPNQQPQPHRQSTKSSKPPPPLTPPPPPPMPPSAVKNLT
ncbi:hypothetical protein As57867_004407, partial [Aphanomyces stellatus]